MANLQIFYERRLVGAVAVDTDGPAFTYDRRWLATRGAFPISLLMPLRPDRFGPETFAPWAANLLPESEQLVVIGRTLGVATTDIFGLLKQIGRDTAGALSIGAPQAVGAGELRPIESPADLERILNDLPAKPFLVGERGVSMSLAGVQTKIGVAVTENGRVAVPLDGAPSTHILKPDSDRLWGGVQNEAFCLTLAGQLGVPTPKLTTGTAGARSYLLVERYDRIRFRGKWRRTHQEDFCQALGKPPSAKYESNNTGVRGPTLDDMFDLVYRHFPLEDISRLLDMLIVNILACNTDAHAKNYALKIDALGPRLAPMYDVMCGEVWDGITKNLAQKIAGKNRGDHLKGRHWQRMAKSCGLNPRQVLDRVAALAARTLEMTASAERLVAEMPAGPHPTLPRVRAAIESRARALAHGLGQVESGDGRSKRTGDRPVPKLSENLS